MPTNYIIYLVLLVLALYFGISYLIANKMIFHKGFKNGGLVNHSDPFFKPSFDWYQNVPKEDVHIQGYDGITLKGVYIPSIDKNSLKTAIVVHGYAGQNTDMLIIAKTYSELGFKVLLIDLRGHGLSDGHFSTFGHYESYDIKKWINYVLRIYGSTDKLLLHGVSMGAASVLLTTKLDLPENVKLIVADSPYSSIAPVLVRKVKTPLILLFLPGLSLITWIRLHFSLMNLSVAKAVKNSKISTVFVHGMKDEACPYQHTLKMLESSQAPFKDIYTVLNAKHAESYILEKAGIDAWITKIIHEIFAVKTKKK